MLAIITALAICATDTGSTEYRWPIIEIIDTRDFQWSRIDTVKAVYYEPNHTTVLRLDGKAQQWKAPYVVIKIEGVK